MIRPRRAEPPDRGRTGGPRGQRQADMAAAVHGAVVPQRAVHGRRGMTDEDTMKQIAQNYKSGELDRPGRAGPGVPSGRRPGAVAVLAHLHRHRDDEGPRGQPVHGRQGAGPAGPGAQGAGHGGAAGRDGHLQEGDEQARLLHPAGLLAVRRGHRGGRGGRGVQGRPAGRGGRQRVRAARRVQLDPGQPVRRGAAGRGPRARRVLHRGRHRHAGRAPRRAAARRDLPGHRPRPDRPAGGPAAGRGRRSGWSGWT